MSKIAILVGGLPPLYNGGTEIATVQIAEYATKAGHEVHIIAADGTNQGLQPYRELENGFNVHRVRTIPPHYLHGLSYIPEALRIVRRIKPDVIHAQAMYIAPTALMANKIWGIPYIFYERGGVYLDWALNKTLYSLFMKNAQRVIAQTENQKDALLKYSQRNIEVIPNGIEINRFGKSDKHESRNKLGFPQDRKIVLSVGRCRPEKNLKAFVEAAKLGINDTLFVLAGEGQQLEELKSLADGKVVFLGGVNNKYIPDYMASADLLVNTSFSEGFPVALLEGMAAGLPIVAPRICGIPEIITNEINGLLTIPQNYVSTYEAVLRILTDNVLAQKMSINNKEKAKQYTWESVVGRLYN